MTIASLKVVLAAKTAAFTAGMKRAGTRVKAFSARVTAAAGRMRMFGRSMIAMAAGAAASVVGVRAMNKMAGVLDSLGKTAAKLGATTEGLALLRWQAEHAGMSTQGLDLALQRLVRRAGEASAGIGTSAKAFKALNLDAKALAQMPADKAMRRFLEALGRVNNTTVRAAYAFKIVGREGTGVLNMIDALSTKSYPATLRLARSLGILFSRRQIHAVETMNDAFLDLRTKLASIAGQALVRLAPALEGLFQRLTTALGDPTTAGAKFAGWLKTTASWLVSIMDTIRGVVLDVAHVFLEIAHAAMLAFGRIVHPVGGAPHEWTDELNAMRAKINKLRLDLASGREKTWGEQLLDMFQAADAAAARLAKTTIKIPPALGRISEAVLGGAQATAVAAAEKARIMFSRPTAFGGLLPGGMPAVSRWVNPNVELTIQRQQLIQLTNIHKAIKQQRSPGLGV